MVSIIVPVYNAEKTIKKCVDSILSQSVHNKEIILVNDGSKDTSLEIIKSFADKHPEIKIIDKKNGGVSSARNAGLKQCCGEFVVFIDSDDYYLDDNYILNMMSVFNRDEGTDLVISGYTVLQTEGKKEYEPSDSSFTVREIAKDYLKLIKEGFISSPVNKLFKRSLINHEFDERMTMGEDAIFVLDYLKKCQKVTFCHGCGYGYVFMNESSTADFRKKTAYDVKQTNIYHLAICDFWLGILDEKESAENYIVLITESVYLTLHKIWSIKGKIKYFKEDIKPILDDSYLKSCEKYLSGKKDYQHIKLTKLILEKRAFSVKCYFLISMIKKKLKKM